MSYEELDAKAKDFGGVYFIAKDYYEKDFKDGKMQSVIRDDKKQSPIFEFNINNAAGLATLFECEKALADQNIAYMNEYVFWLGEPVATSGLQYLSSARGKKSVPVTQGELIHKVNQTIDTSMEFMTKSTLEYKQVYLDPSPRMSYFMNENSMFGIFVRKRYPELFIVPK